MIDLQLLEKQMVLFGKSFLVNRENKKIKVGDGKFFSEENEGYLKDRLSRIVKYREAIYIFIKFYNHQIFKTLRKRGKKSSSSHYWI